MAIMTGLMILITVETMMAMITIMITMTRAMWLMTLMQWLRRGLSRKEPSATSRRCWLLMLIFVCVMEMLLPVMVMMLFVMVMMLMILRRGFNRKERLQPRLRRSSPFHFHLSSEYASIKDFWQCKWCQNHFQYWWGLWCQWWCCWCRR